MYADDVQLYSSTSMNNLGACIQNINSDLDHISEWAKNNGLRINPSKSKCILISKRNGSPIDNINLQIGNSNIELVKTSKNLGIFFNDQLTWSNHINITVGKVYGMLRNLWAVKNSTPFEIRMLLAKSYVLPILFYGSEIFYNCDCNDFHKLKVAFNNISRYIFDKRPRDRISSYSYEVFNMEFATYLKFKSLIFLHKIIFTKEPRYLFEKITFAQSARGKKLIPQMFKSLNSERQFFISTVRLWNRLPHHIQIISSASSFKKEIVQFLNNVTL